MSADTTHTVLAPLERSTNPEMANLIVQVREAALARVSEHPITDFDPIDVQRLREDSPENNWTIERFIRRKPDVEQASDMIIDTMKFRALYNLPSIKPENFPEEFYRIGAIFPFEKDLAGNGCVYMRVRLHRKVKELEHLTKKFTLYNINQVDESSQGHGMSVIFDCSGAGITNLDMDFIWFLIDSVIKYYPIGIQHIIVYEMPWILSSAWTIIKGWMPPEFRDKIVFVDKKTITNYIAAENLPFYMGGKSVRDYHFVPKGCRNSMDLANESGEFTEKEVKKFAKIFQPYLDEADQESRKIQQARENQS